MNTAPEPPPLSDPSAKTVIAPERHGCLTAFLILMLVGNGLTLCVYAFAGDRLSAVYPNAPVWMPYALGLGCAANLFLTVALFRWKKWAFFAFCGIALCMFLVNLRIGVPLLNSVVGLAGPAVLYGVLQIGGSKKGWSQLR